MSADNPYGMNEDTTRKLKMVIEHISKRRVYDISNIDDPSTYDLFENLWYCTGYTIGIKNQERKYFVYDDFYFVLVKIHVRRSEGRCALGGAATHLQGDVVERRIYNEEFLPSKWPIHDEQVERLERCSWPMAKYTREVLTKFVEYVKNETPLTDGSPDPGGDPHYYELNKGLIDPVIKEIEFLLEMKDEDIPDM